MEYKICEHRKGIKICTMVCDNNIFIGKCTKDKKGKCKPIRKNHLSGEERERRRARMIEIRERR